MKLALEAALYLLPALALLILTQGPALIIARERERRRREERRRRSGT